MATEYQRRSRGNAQPRVPLQEVGLKALGPITRALAKAPPSKSAPVLQAVSSLLQHVAPLRLFDDFSPAHAPPEAPLRIAAAQLTADSTRSGGSYAVANAFASTSADPSEEESSSQWCSKGRPSNSKSVVTVAFTRPEQLTGVFLALPRDAKVRSELVGLEALHAPSSGAETAADIAAYVTKPGVRWTALGVVSAEVLASGGRRLPLTAHNVVGLRLSFKGFAKTNTDKHHGLARAVVFAASDRIRPGVGGLALHTDAAAVLHTLGNWFRSVGLAPEAGAAALASPPAAAGGEPNPEAQYAAIASLSGLSLATGSLASVLSLLEVLMAHDKPLPAPVAAGVRAFLRRVDEQYDAVGRLCDDSEGGEAAAADPDRTAEAKWVDKSGSVTLSEDDRRARSSSSPEYAALNIGISRGRMVWEMRIEEDSRDGECQCFGFCRKPVTTYSYESSGNNMWLWRAYNGQLYANGSSGESKAKFHEGEIVRFELDMEEGVCKAWANGVDQGVLFKDLKGQGPFYPCAQFYSSSRACTIRKVEVYGQTGGAAAGAGAVKGASAFLDGMKVAATEGPQTAPLGLGSNLGVPLEEGTAGSGAGAAPTPLTNAAGEVIQRPTTLHGRPVTHGVAVSLAGGGERGASHKVTYQLGTPAGAEEDGGRGKKGKAKEAQPSPYDVFEAVVGLADWVTDPSSSPAEADSAAAAAAAAAAADEEAAAAAVAAASRGAAVSAAEAADSKDEGGHIERESKGGEAAAPARGGGASESKGPAGAAVPSSFAAPAAAAAAGVTRVTFRVHGDGKLLWTSASVPVPAPSASGVGYATYGRLPLQHVLLNVAGVNSLELEVVTTGEAGPTAYGVWGDARVRRAPWVRERLAFESEMAAAGPASGLPANVGTLAPEALTAATEAEAEEAGAAARTAADAAPYPLLRAVQRYQQRAAAAAAASGATSVPAAAAPAVFRYTHRLLQPDVQLTGPAAAAALLRLLRLFAREAYRPVRVSRPPPAFGDPSLPLEVPFAVQADGRVFATLARLLKGLYERVKRTGAPAGNSSSSSSSSTLQAESLAALLLVTKGNLRRVVATRVLPADVGIQVAAEAPAAGAAGGAKGGKARAEAVTSPTPSPAAAASEPLASPDAAAGAASAGKADKEAAKEAAKAGTLGPLLEVLNAMISANAAAGSSASGAAPSSVPAEVSAEAAGVLDTGLPLFFPSAASQAAFLGELLGKGEGGVLEVQFAWPTPLATSDKGAAAALAAIKATGKAEAGKDGGEAKAEAAAASAAVDRLMKDGGDPRFERLVLLLQAYATRRGFAHSTVGHYGRFLHLVVSLPDTPEAPISRTLSADLASVFEAAGFPGWAFPQGCASPDVGFKIERFLQFNRRERLATDPGIGWVRLYPRRAGSIEGVLAQVRGFLDGYVAEEAAAAKAAAAAGKEGAEADAAASAAAADADTSLAGGAGKGEKERAPAVDVFGDPLDVTGHEDDASDAASEEGSEDGSEEEDEEGMGGLFGDEEEGSGTEDEEEEDGDDDDDEEGSGSSEEGSDEDL